MYKLYTQYKLNTFLVFLGHICITEKVLVSIMTWSLGAPDINSTDTNQLFKEAYCGIPTRVHSHLPELMLNHGWDPIAGFSQGWLLLDLLISGALSDLVLIDSVVQYWLLAIDSDCITVGLSFESPHKRTICRKRFCVFSFPTTVCCLYFINIHSKSTI